MSGVFLHGYKYGPVSQRSQILQKTTLTLPDEALQEEDEENYHKLRRCQAS